ncbi:AAA family ATPase [Aquimarina sp. I32.4]|uniref:AAA family ATPase n=1 Tax=Aquimarina sp. I32.4 TaxID=2053903 RepID=UPI000CDEA19C|nr:AAA family ATPase [Aquimarina sp. I32.4]
MHISLLSIRNFRNFNSLKFISKMGVNTILGENRSGKTNLFLAIHLLFDGHFLRLSYKLNEDDFTTSL